MLLVIGERSKKKVVSYFNKKKTEVFFIYQPTIVMHIVFFVFSLFHFIAQFDSSDQNIFTLNNNTNQIVLRGTNYLRLISTRTHVLFEPDLYSLWDIETALEQMHSYGYNYVRVFLDCPNLFRGFGLSLPGVSINYTTNVVDFLLRASKYNISVMLTASWNPANYQSIINSYPKPANVTRTNLMIFHAGQAAAKAQFLIDLLKGIKNISLISFENIFAIDIFDEISVSVH